MEVADSVIFGCEISWAGPSEGDEKVKGEGMGIQFSMELR